MDCEKWLEDFFERWGTVTCEFVREEAQRNGYSKIELKKARKTLGVKAWHQFDEETDGHLNYFWYIPGKGGIT